MTTPTAPMTKLDAVNELLGSIGQSPVNTITGTIPPDAAKAVLELDTSLRQVLTQGWSFNTDIDYPLTPDGSQNILIPSNALVCAPERADKDYVQRWDAGVPKFYDRDDRTFTITEEVKCKIVWAYPFEEIPQHARNYVTAKAGRMFQAKIVGSRILHAYTQEMETEAWNIFKRVEKRAKRYNFLTDDPTAHRHRNPYRY